MSSEHYSSKKIYKRKSSLADQHLTSELVKSGTYVKFQTNHKKDFIQDSGYILGSEWFDEKRKVATYDIITKLGAKFRIITDPIKYPKDTLIF